MSRALLAVRTRANSGKNGIVLQVKRMKAINYCASSAESDKLIRIQIMIA